MGVRGLTNVRNNLIKVKERITGPMAQTAVTEVLIFAMGYSAGLTPIDTSTLINSQFRELHVNGTRIYGTVGYTAAYAAAVHGMSGKLRGQPRAHFGKTGAGKEFGGGTGVGNYWDPQAEPGFLRKAFENTDARADIDAIIRRGMKL